MSGHYYIKTFGCQMNEYDSQKMADILENKYALTATDSANKADVILINTCSIREKAQEKVFDMLGRFKQYKTQKPNVIIGVTGCVASQEGDAIIKRAPFVDLVIGPQTIHRLPDLIDSRRQSGQPVVDISFPEIEKFDCLPEPKTKGVKAYLSIMEGCSKYCSYCVVPYTRGEEISRPFDDVLAEAMQLANQGVREITLLGQNVNAYQGPMHDGGIADLALVIQYISAIDSICRIRFTTSHPMEFSQSLIEAYAEVPKLANHLHLPVQSGSDRILARMKRNHTVLEFKNKVKRLRAVRPDIPISTDFIVGFPGETDQDFEQTMALVHDIGFDQSFSFIYSPRPGTPASNLQDLVPMETKKKRLNILQDRLTQNAIAISESMVGQTHWVLVDGVAKKNDQELSGRTENNRAVIFKGDKRLIGQLVEVKIQETRRITLKGELVNAELFI